MKDYFFAYQIIIGDFTFTDNYVLRDVPRGWKLDEVIYAFQKELSIDTGVLLLIQPLNGVNAITKVIRVVKIISIFSI